MEAWHPPRPAHSRVCTQALLLQHVLDARLAGHQVDERLAQARKGGRRAQRRLPLPVLRLRARASANTALLYTASSRGQRGSCCGSSDCGGAVCSCGASPYTAAEQRRQPRQRRRRAAGRASTSAPLDARKSAAGRLAAAQATNSGDWPCPRHAVRVRRWALFFFFFFGTRTYPIDFNTYVPTAPSATGGLCQVAGHLPRLQPALRQRFTTTRAVSARDPTLALSSAPRKPQATAGSNSARQLLQQESFTHMQAFAPGRML